MTRNDRETRQFNTEEQQRFLGILHRDSRGGSVICVQFHNGDLSMQQVTKDITEINGEQIKDDVYVSVNSFKTSGGPFTSRRAENVYSLNAMYIDLDLPGHKRNEDSEMIIHENLDMIHEAVSDGRLPRYTMITSTGNGLGVFFVLTNSIANTSKTAKQQQYFDTLYDLLAERMKDVLSECGEHALIVDSSVIGDHARICRLPGTRNSKSGTMCTLLEVNERGCCNLFEYSKILSRDTAEKTQNTNKKGKTKNTGEKRFVSSFYHAQLLMKLEQLQKERSSWRGHREVFCFVYYNTAKQCLEYQDAVKSLRQFNDDLGERIEESRIKSIIRSVDSNSSYDGSYAGYYKLTNLWICNKLGLDENEIKKYGLDGGCSWEDRNQQAHLDVVRKRLDTEKKVVELLISEERPTYETVSDYSGASIATVKRIALKYRVRKCDDITAVSIDWDALYQEIEDAYKEERLKVCRNRIKTCTSVVISPINGNSMSSKLASESGEDEFLGLNSCETNCVHEEDDLYSENNGWVSTECSFEELTDGSNPFDFDSLDSSSLKANETPKFECDISSLSSVEVFERNALYGDSFLAFLMKGAGDRTLKMYQAFADAFYCKINAFNANHEYAQSNLLYVLLDMIADQYRTSPSIDLCIWDIDKLYRFTALDSCNLRDYEIKVTKQSASEYVAPNNRFLYTPEYLEIPEPKTNNGVKNNRMRARELDSSDIHMIKIAHLLDTDEYRHVVDVLHSVSEGCELSPNVMEHENGLRIAGLLKHLPTFGEKRIENIMNALKEVPETEGSTELVNILCNTLHCKPETLGTVKNDLDKMKRKSPAQKRAGIMYRRHQDTMNWCRHEKQHNVTCRTYLNSYSVLSNDKYKNLTFTINDKPVARDVIRKQYLYPVSVDDLKNMPVMHDMQELMNWIISHPVTK